MNNILDISDLSLSFKTLTSKTDVLHAIDLRIEAGEKVALVGESGSGKSVTAKIVLGLLQETRSARVSGRVLFEGNDINTMTRKARASLRGTKISMIFQDPTSSLNPVFTIGHLFNEVLRRGNPELSASECNTRAKELLAEVSLPDIDRVLSSYAFQLSGGMNQRVIIALALANQPSLLLADEPGTALDVSVQAQTLKVMHQMVTTHDTSVLFISHNLGVVREFADRVYVIYRGNIVEDGKTSALFNNPQHAYTQALLAAVPRITGGGLPAVAEHDEAFLLPRVSHGSEL